MAPDQGNEQNQSPRRRTNPADNLTRDDRIRGGKRSAESQRRGPSGQFAGRVERSAQSRNSEREQESSNEPSDQQQGGGQGG